MATRKGISSLARRKLLVLVDLDETIAAFEKHFFKLFREKYPNEPFVPLEKRCTFHISDQYERLNFTEDDMINKIKQIYKDQYFFRDLPEIDGGCDAVKEMDDMEGVEVFLCTSPLFYYKYSAPEKFEWVEKHLGPSWINKIILTRDKTMIQGHVLIDDKVNITGAIMNPSWEHIVFTSPHNKDMKLNGKRRLENWTDGKWREIIEDLKKRL